MCKYKWMASMIQPDIHDTIVIVSWLWCNDTVACDVIRVLAYSYGSHKEGNHSQIHNTLKMWSPNRKAHH